jgi:hypothetical protein
MVEMTMGALNHQVNKQTRRLNAIHESLERISSPPTAMFEFHFKFCGFSLDVR